MRRLPSLLAQSLLLAALVGARATAQAPPPPEPADAQAFEPPDELHDEVHTEPPPPPPAGPRRAASPAARVELGVIQTLMGLGNGALICGLAECDAARAWAGAALAGGGAFVVGALMLSVNGISTERAQAINLGGFWGAGLGALAYFSLMPEDNWDVRPALGGTLAAEVLGYASAYLIDWQIEPSAGAWASANAFALWGFSEALMIASMTDGHSARALTGVLLAGSVAGAITGGAVGERFAFSRGRPWLGTTGFVLGGGILPLVAWLIAGNGIRKNAVLGSAVGGSLAGATVGLVLSRNMDAHLRGRRLPSLTIAPRRGGATVHAVLRL